MYLRHLGLLLLVKLNLLLFSNKMQTFFAEALFADIAIIQDIVVEEMVQLMVQIFHCARHLTIIDSIDNIGSYYSELR